MVLLCGMAASLVAQMQPPPEVHVNPSPDADAVRLRAALPADAPELTLRHARPLHVDVDLVQVPITVTDPLNRPVLGLGQQNFTVYEDGEAQKIQYFAAEDAPISVGLVLDLSKSMVNKFVTEREAVEDFFNNANPQDDYFVVGFSDSPKLLATPTQSLEEIQQKLTAAVPDGRTALLDAVYLAMARMHKARYQRKALLIVSDGGDNHSRYGLREIKNLVQESDVEVYAIGIFDSFPFGSFEEFMGRRWLGEITDSTGGRTVATTTLDKVPELAAAISREMRNQYVLAYHPSKAAHDGKWRKIKVLVHPHPASQRVQAYYKKGYLPH